MVEVKKVVTKGQRHQFVNFPLRLYKKTPYYAPALYSDEMKAFTEDNVYKNTCDDVFFLAYKDKKVVGRIQGIIQRQYNELHNEKRVRFTRFDCIDDQEVADALFDAVIKWAKSYGMTQFCGPLGYSDLEREGLLISGFDEYATFEEQYNFPYYQKLIENSGFSKDVDWVEYKIYAPKTRNDMLSRVAKRALEMNELHVVDSSVMTKKEFINKVQDGFFDCIDECYASLYGTVPFTDEMKEQLIDQFMLIINKKYLIVVCDKNERVVAIGLCFPAIGKALKRSGGRLTPAALVRLLHAIRHPKVIDLALVAVRPEYQSRGVPAVMIEGMLEMLVNGDVVYCETNLNLEDNVAVQSMWKYFTSIQHKRRRSFVKDI